MIQLYIFSKTIIHNYYQCTMILRYFSTSFETQQQQPTLKNKFFDILRTFYRFLKKLLKMVFLRSFGLVSKTWIVSESSKDLKIQLELPEGIKLYRNGKLIEDNDIFEQNDVIEIVGGLLGGKGGFGSMLRALGNQIQKTTNKEACRDLSGRRLRDINEEKRMKSFVSKQADRYVHIYVLIILIIKEKFIFWVI